MSPDSPELERVLFRFLRELPSLPSAVDLGIATSAVKPWPHQLRVVRRVVERYPQSFLFADEVGLGKTIQAATALRCLWLAGRVRRCLILVPKALLRQWQEELHEKVALSAARFDGGAFFDVRGQPLDPENKDEANPWNRHDLILASTQLARGPARRREILEAEPWDLVIVDEAHHARRRLSKTSAQSAGTFKPNRLLELLAGDGEQSTLHEGGGLRGRSRALYLLTATPMQIHPLEVWDLLRLLGLGGRWGADERAFLGYFEQLKRPFAERDWDALLELASESELAPPDALESLRTGAVSTGQRRDIDDWLRRATPIGELVWRHTRTLLRSYKQRGLLDAGVPERRPKNVWIELSPRQRRLYGRIESYLAEFYQRYEARRTGLGFVMTVYRRRLTSSFAAVRLSLERRRNYLLGREVLGALREDGNDETGLDLGSIGGHQQELTLDDAPELPTATVFSRDELTHLDEILAEMEQLDGEPKLARLDADLRRFLRRRDRVLIFTQYLDTLDQLRDSLAPKYRVACYSGRGGERLRDESWQLEPKEKLKRAFASGEIEVLLCTEAASEGLNLQTCGVLINYDMPWNPMRVEQRIGRIDRIGQQYPRVWIRNYFYADTVEATIYQRLGDRIDWFKTVLGELQPILHGVGEAVEELALVPEQRRRRKLEEWLLALRGRIEEAPVNPVSLDGPTLDGPVLDGPEPEGPHLPSPPLPRTGEGGAGVSLGGGAGSDGAGSDGADSDIEAPARAPVTPAELEQVFRESEAFGDLLEATGEPGVYRLLPEGRPVTFDPELYAERPYSLHLLTWGTPVFERLIASVAEPSSSPDPAGLGLYTSQNPAPVSVFAAPGGDVGGTEIAAVTGLGDLRRLLEAPPGRWSDTLEADAASLFSQRRQQVLRGLQDVEAGRRRAERQALRTEAGELLVRSATLQLIAARNPGLFDEPLTYSWGREAIEAQAARGGPYPDLLTIAEDDLEVQADSPQSEDLRAHSPDQLARAALEVEQRAWQVSRRWRALLDADAAASEQARAVARGSAGAPSPSSAGLLERLYFPLSKNPEKSPYIEPPELEPFRNAVPLLGDLADAAATITDALLEGQDPLTDIARQPDRHTWLRWSGRVAPAPDLFAATVPSRALEPRVPVDSLALLRFDPTPPRVGQLVLVDGVFDPETGANATLRAWNIEKRRGQDPRLRLDALASDIAPIVIDEPDEIRVVARFVEVAEERID